MPNCDVTAEGSPAFVPVLCVPVHLPRLQSQLRPTYSQGMPAPQSLSESCLRAYSEHVPSADQGHAMCVTEVDKYAKGATKPGGYAAQGYYKDSSGATVAVVAQAPANASEPADTVFLSTRPPWTCSVCNVTCTSQDTLQGHAAGVKHRRRV